MPRQWAAVPRSRHIQEVEGAPLFAIHLHKAKFEQRKALEEYRGSKPVSTFLPGEVYDWSEKMVKTRGENSEHISVEYAWKTVAEGETWVGSPGADAQKAAGHLSPRVSLPDWAQIRRATSYLEQNLAERLGEYGLFLRQRVDTSLGHRKDLGRHRIQHGEPDGGDDEGQGERRGHG